MSTRASGAAFPCANLQIRVDLSTESMRLTGQPLIYFRRRTRIVEGGSMMTNESDRILAAYTAIAKAKASKVTTKTLPPDERREYLRAAKQRSRERTKAAASEGRLEANADAIRDVLADAALILLASGAPGADAVEKLLGIAFAGRPGVAGTVKAKARAGAIRPKLLTPEVLRAAKSPSA